ncbi:MAG: polyprenyl synthetase family protein [Vulcanimicrobiaceae bacterium]
MRSLADDDATMQSLVEAFFSNGFTTDNPLITEAVKRMLAAGGKRLRPRIALLAAEACGGNAAEHLHLAAYMELIHVATLIHDDVVDRAQVRRGVNATAVDYGNRISVLAGDYLFAWIFKNVTAGYAPPVPHILSATLASICDGEVLQLRGLGRLDVSLDEYVEVARKKTASLFAASAQCGAIVAGGTAAEIAALHEYGQAYGIAFQMRDDLLDVIASQRTLGKPVGNDVRERKMTIPIILALATGDVAFTADVKRWYHDGEEQAVAPILRGISDLDATSATREALSAYVVRAKAALEPLGASPARTELQKLADDLVGEED